MPAPRVFRGSARANVDYELLARIIDRIDPGENQLLDPADCDSVEFRIFARNDRAAIYEVTGLTPSDYLAAVATENDPEWTPPGGRNLRFPVSIATLARAGVTLQPPNVYTHQLTFVRSSGSPIVHLHEVEIVRDK